jgi:Domain of unknown function (DUF1844)
MAPQEREEEQREQGFVVSDKRLFTKDGERRETEDRTATPNRPEAERTAPPQASAPPPKPPPADRPAASEPRSRQGELAIDFSTYVVMLANTVMMLLGQMPDPATQQRHLDLPQAKHTIDILIMLRDKTRGNLTAEEAKLLEDVMPQLQMAYVSVSRQAKA